MSFVLLFVWVFLLMMASFYLRIMRHELPKHLLLRNVVMQELFNRPDHWSAFAPELDAGLVTRPIAYTQAATTTGTSQVGHFDFLRATVTLEYRLPFFPSHFDSSLAVKVLNHMGRYLGPTSGPVFIPPYLSSYRSNIEQISESERNLLRGQADIVDTY